MAWREFDSIRLIQKTLKTNTRKGVELGIGDDCAVVKFPSHEGLLTVDALVENIHFRWDWMTPEQVGRKALAVNLSDLASMGGIPQYALVSLGLPPSFPTKRLEGIYRGLLGLANSVGLAVVGGNITSTRKDFFIDVSLIGESSRPLTRSGMKKGDLVFVTGVLGESRVGLLALKKWGKRVPASFKRVVLRHQEPLPRLKEGVLLSKNPGVHSLIDVSDGLSSELWHLSTASKRGIVIDAEKVPIYNGGHELPGANEAAWQGGEDYELLGTVSPKAWPSLDKAFRKLGCPITVIGYVDGPHGVQVLRKGTLRPLQRVGWVHQSR